MINTKQCATYSSRLLIPLTLFLTAGIWWQTISNSTYAVLLPCIAATVAFCLATKIKQDHFVFCTLSLSVFFLGNFLCIFQKKQHRATQTELCGKSITLKGTVTALEKSRQKFLRTIVTLTISNIKNGAEWKPQKGAIQIYTRNENYIKVGDTIELNHVTFKHPANSFNRYLMKQGIAATVCLPSLNYKLTHRPPWSIRRWLHTMREQTKTKLKQKLSRKTFNLLSSIFLGNRTEAPYQLETTKQQFKFWGILHFLARSGLHLVIFVLLWEFILTLLPIAFIYKQLLLILFGIIYGFLSWPSIPFIRALSIFFLYKASPLLNTRAHFLHLLALIIFVILTYNPTLLMFLDFQLSFGLTLALAWFGHQQRQNRRVLKNC